MHAKICCHPSLLTAIILNDTFLILNKTTTALNKLDQKQDFACNGRQLTQSTAQVLLFDLPLDQGQMKILEPGEVIKLFMLSSTETKLYPAHKC